MYKIVTVPVRGIRLHHVVEETDNLNPDGYCPREGYKVASVGKPLYGREIKSLLSP